MRVSTKRREDMKDIQQPDDYSLPLVQWYNTLPTVNKIMVIHEPVSNVINVRINQEFDPDYEAEQMNDNYERNYE